MTRPCCCQCASSVTATTRRTAVAMGAWKALGGVQSQRYVKLDCLPHHHANPSYITIITATAKWHHSGRQPRHSVSPCISPHISYAVHKLRTDGDSLYVCHTISVILCANLCPSRTYRSIQVCSGLMHLCHLCTAARALVGRNTRDVHDHLLGDRQADHKLDGNISTVAPAVQCYAKPKMRQLAGAAGCMLHKGLMMTSPLL